MMKMTLRMSVKRIFLVLVFLGFQSDCLSIAPTQKLNITVFTQTSTWNEAYFTCRDHDMELLTMKSQDTVDALRLLYDSNSTISLRDEDYWIGLYYVKEEHEGYFQWIDGEDLGNWTRWFSSEPNHLESDRCVRLHDDPVNSFEWKTRTCNSHYAFICQQNIGNCTMELTPFHPVQQDRESTEVSSEQDCIILCQSVIPYSSNQCYFSYFDVPNICHMYLSENSSDFVQVKETMSNDKHFYRKTCFQGFHSHIKVNYTNSHKIPLFMSSDYNNQSTLRPVVMPSQDWSTTTALVSVGKPELSDTSVLLTPVESSEHSNMISSSETPILSKSTSEIETLYDFSTPTTSQDPVQISFGVVSSALSSDWTLLEITSSRNTESHYSEDVLRTTLEIMTEKSNIIPARESTVDSSLKQCECPCPQYEEASNKELESLIETLLIPKKQTSLYQRKLYSMSDKRTSSKSLGIFGIMLVLLPFVLNTLYDCSKMIKQLCKRFDEVRNHNQNTRIRHF